ncbi:hypothetical protein ACNKHK_27260 [Shigella flexneri]
MRDGSQVVTLNRGTRFEGTAPLLRDFRITDFQDYQAIIGHQAVALDPNDTEQMTMRRRGTDPHRARAGGDPAYHVSIHRIDDGADGCTAERGKPALGSCAVDAASKAALFAGFPLTHR